MTHDRATAQNFAFSPKKPITVLERPLPQLYAQVQSYLLTHNKTAHTIRNIKNNLSRLIRFATAADLLAPPPAGRPLVRRFGKRETYHRPGAEHCRRRDGTYLPYEYWPIPLQQAFQAFARWCTNPLTPGRPGQWRKRPITLWSYKCAFASYFGYLYHIQHIKKLSFDDLFNFDYIEQYVHWHVNTRYDKPTIMIKTFLARLLTLTNQYRVLPELNNQLRLLDRQISQPSPQYDKTNAWVSMATLKEIGQALWPHQPPSAIKSAGTFYA